MAQPVGPIPVQAPVPSILTTARDRTADGFGVTAPIPSDAADALREAGIEANATSWRGGVAWPSFSCQESLPWPDCVDDPDPKELSDTGLSVSSVPFTIYTPLECEWASGEPFLGPAARALTEAHTAYGLARALWMGEGLPVAVSQSTLRNSATVIAGVYDLDDGVAQLLGAYEEGTFGNGGAILHVPGILATAAQGGLPGGGTVARLEGQVYRGPNGSLISFGPGYPWGESTEGADGFGPMTDPDPLTFAASAADEVWVYVTGPVEYARGPIEIKEAQAGSALRRNTVEVLAERRMVYRFDPCSVWALRVFNPTGAGGS
jgi:hypothetical protein